MAPLFLDPGLLDKRVAIERDMGAPDRFGGAETRWVEVGETSARVEPANVRVREALGQRLGALTHRVTLRARDGLERGMAFRIGRRRLVVRSVHDPDETGRWLVCRCEEEA